jgi:hypothetical protein
MIRTVALFFLMLVPVLAQAQIDSQFTFNGQNAEVLKSEKTIQITTPVQVQVPDTCSRQVPTGQAEVCRNQTRYRQECSWIPSSQQCRTENERVCRSVTRYRQECSTGPSRQVCTDIPSRTVCTERPTREVCTTRPNGTQHCTTVGGGQTCNQVGGGRTCRSEPGERTCRQVSYQDQDCDYVPRQRCETIPGRNDCRDIPYSERVCNMETQYRTETYACTRTETQYRTSQKVIKAETNVSIITNGLVEEFPVSVSINEENYAMTVKLLKEPSVFVVLKKKEAKAVSTTEKEIIVQGTVVLEVMTKEMLPIAFPTTVTSAVIEESTKKLTLVFEGALSAQGSVDLAITYKGFLTGLRKIAEIKAEYPSAKVELGTAGDKAALSIDLKDSMLAELQKKNMLLRLTLGSQMNLQGELMNATKPVATKAYQGPFVQIK